jgi:ADP-L-glycero-D-manno-heptose 6-epimerase
MKILITGNRGFIGQNMTLALAEHEITTYEWKDSAPIVRDLDWVIHLGAISSTTEQHVEKVLLQNYDFSKWLLNECNTYKVNFQYASSASIYGLHQVFTEDSLVNPLSPYAWSKYLFERYVQENQWTNIVVQGFRYFNVYGPYEDHKGTQASPHHQFDKQARETGTITLFEGSDTFFRDFVPVTTLIDVHKAFFNVNESGIFNIGTGKVKSFKDIADVIAKKYNATIKYIPMPENIKYQYQTYTKANLTKLNKYYKP